MWAWNMQLFVSKYILVLAVKKFKYLMFHSAKDVLIPMSACHLEASIMPINHY